MNLKKEMYLLATLSMLFLGCGGGSGSNPDDNGSSGGDDKPVAENFKYDKISIAGSSITWGAGYLGEESYVGEVEKYFREDVADTIGVYDNLTASEIINEPMSYGGKLHRYNTGDKITGTLEASEKIAIVYAVKNVVGNAVVEMIVDGTSLGKYTINSTTDINPVRRHPDVGIRSFRENNENAIKVWELDENKEHNFTLKIIQGDLLLNFITNHMYHFQNAGIAGYAASTFLMTETGTTTQEIADFQPDLFIFESATNDAKTWIDEKNGNYGTNNWKIEDPVSFTLINEQPKKIQLMQNVSVKEGDVVVMGEYNGNIGTLAVGIVNTDSNSNIITLKQNVPTDISRQCRIKSIKEWEDNVEEVISHVVESNSNVKIGIGTSGVPNYYDPQRYVDDENQYSERFPRRLMGYREKGQILADKNGWMFYDFFNEVKAVEPGVDTATKWSKGDNTHPNANGYPIFGRAVTNVLKAQ